MVSEPRRYLLAVGIKNYDQWPMLSDVPEELERIVGLLTNPPYKFERILQQASETPRAGDLLAQLTEWANASERLPTDQLVIYWTGHGEEYREELHLILSNSGSRPVTKTIPVEKLVASALPDQRGSGGILLLLDVCYSGHGAIDVGQRLGAFSRAHSSVNSPEIVILSASRPREQARQNAFSEAFSEALRQCELDAQEHEPQLYLHKILDFLIEGMPEAQTPVLFNQLSRARFFANPNYQPDPSKRRDAVGLMGRIRHFEAEYLVGNEAARVPFGGRQAELERLDCWLSDPHAEPRLMITAPAGRGKSALLVSWIEALRSSGRINEDGWHLAFVPISLRFETGAPEIHFNLLALQLARIVGGSPGRPATDPARFYADRCRELLLTLAASGKKVLVVLDALDEALTPQIFATVLPKSLPKTLRIVASARLEIGDRDGTGWLTRLDWPANRAYNLDLPILASDQIADVLISMGAPVDIVALEPKLVSRLAELTQGEPLVVRLYAEDLWETAESGKAITRADLDALKPGFGPYFERWLELQEQQWEAANKRFDIATVERLLALLATAKGPLPGKDLLALFRCIFSGAPRPATSQTLLAPLRRFVIGDGKDMPYVLSHPKIGEWLRECRCHELISDVENGFVDWGKRHIEELNAKRTKSEDASTYALQFTRHHFLDSNAAAETFMLFLEDGWRRAWEHFEGGQRGFSGDVQAVLLRLRQDGELAHIAPQCRCALVLSSIRSLGRSLFSSLIVTAVNRGLLSIKQGQHYAELMSNESESIKTNTHLALLSSSHPGTCNDLIQSVLHTIESTFNAIKRDRLLASFQDVVLTSPLSLSADIGINIAYRVLRWTEHSLETETRYQAIAVAAWYIPLDKLDEPLNAVANIKDEARRAHALTIMARNPPSNLAAKILTYIKSITDDIQFINTLATLAPHLCSYLLEDAFVIAMARAEKYKSCFDKPYISYEDYSNQYDFYLAVEDHRHRQAVGKEYYRAISRFPTCFASRFPPKLSEKIKNLSKIASEIGRKEFRETVYPAIHHIPAELIEEIMENFIDKPNNQPSERLISEDLLLAAPYLSPNGAVKRLEAVRQFRNETFRTDALSALIPRLAREALSDLFTSLRRVGDADRCAEAMAVLAPHVDTTAVLAAFASAKTVRSDRVRTKILIRLAPYLPPDRLSEALGIAKNIQYTWGRAQLLGALAPHLSPDLFADALLAAKKIRIGKGRSQALAAFLPFLPPKERQGILAMAYAAAQAITDGGRRAEALQRLAPHLPTVMGTRGDCLSGDTAEISDGDPGWSRESCQSSHLRRVATFLQKAPTLPRPDALELFLRSCDAIEALTPAESLQDIYRTIEDVRNWYP